MFKISLKETVPITSITILLLSHTTSVYYEWAAPEAATRAVL